MLGWGLKHFKWPRPPLVLGFILGSILERYMFISIQRYGTDWMLRPARRSSCSRSPRSACSGRCFRTCARMAASRAWCRISAAPHFSWHNLFPVFLLVLFGVMMTEAVTWNPLAKIVPLIVGSGAILFCSLALITEVFKKGTVKATSLGEKAMEQVQQKMHMDIASTVSHLPAKTLLTRGAIFFGWMVGFLLSMATIGLIPTVPLFVIAFMRLEAREPWRIVLPYALIMAAFHLLSCSISCWRSRGRRRCWAIYFPDLRGVIPSV